MTAQKPEPIRTDVGLTAIVPVTEDAATPAPSDHEHTSDCLSDYERGYWDGRLNQPPQVEAAGASTREGEGGVDGAVSEYPPLQPVETCAGRVVVVLVDHFHELDDDPDAIFGEHPEVGPRVWEGDAVSFTVSGNGESVRITIGPAA